ncbi:MAG: hypothetical protein PHY47_18040 [Lachnospiraceae bacterium]|nr:hypothetical protein [Lachnospiraceae bacterium]
MGELAKVLQTYFEKSYQFIKTTVSMSKMDLFGAVSSGHCSRFLEMVAPIQDKQDENGLFTPEAVYQKCKNWDFGQKNSHLHI